MTFRFRTQGGEAAVLRLPLAERRRHLASPRRTTSNCHSGILHCLTLLTRRSPFSFPPLSFTSASLLLNRQITFTSLPSWCTIFQAHL